MTTTSSVVPIHLVRELLEGQHGDVLLAMLSSMLHSVMEAEVTERTGAGLGERSVDREVHRNGYRERPLETRLGTVNLAIPASLTEKGPHALARKGPPRSGPPVGAGAPPR
jgi:hypothetical protein